MSTREYGDKPPLADTEIGYVHNEYTIPGISMDWASFDLDAREYVPDLKWPNSIVMYDRMRNDPQVSALLTGLFMPVTRMRWEVDPNGAKAEVANNLADDLGLGVMGKKRKIGRRRNRFNHSEHLRLALLDKVYGHMYFEQVGSIEIFRGRPMWRLQKLAPRMPYTIEGIKVARDGGLEWIEQKWDGMTTGQLHGPRISIDRLVCFVNEKEGANWFGRSLLRAAYQPWLLKDRLLRVDAIRHERNGMGIPFVTLPERATDEQKKLAASLAQQYRTGVASGGALPYGMEVQLKGVDGTTSDVLSSIRYHDESMARLMLQMFTQLGGGGEYGSKALGDTFVKFFAKAQDAAADGYAEVMNEYMITDWVNWNYGTDEPPPRLVYKRDEDPDLSAQEFAQLVAQGVITVDTETENFLRDRYGLPELKGERPTFRNIPRNTEGGTDFAKETGQTGTAKSAMPPAPGKPNTNVRAPKVTNG